MPLSCLQDAMQMVLRNQRLQQVEVKLQMGFAVDRVCVPDGREVRAVVCWWCRCCCRWLLLVVVLDVCCWC